MTNNQDLKNQGEVTCNKNILLSIVNLATSEINGVAGLSKRYGNIISKTFQNKDYNGIKISYAHNGGVIVDVYIDIYYNQIATDVCFRVQENIKNNIKSMLDMKVEKVNVHILDVIIKPEDNVISHNEKCDIN